MCYLFNHNPDVFHRHQAFDFQFKFTPYINVFLYRIIYPIMIRNPLRSYHIFVTPHLLQHSSRSWCIQRARSNDVIYEGHFWHFGVHLSPSWATRVRTQLLHIIARGPVGTSVCCIKTFMVWDFMSILLIVSNIVW